MFQPLVPIWIPPGQPPRVPPCQRPHAEPASRPHFIQLLSYLRPAYHAISTEGQRLRVYCEGLTRWAVFTRSLPSLQTQSLGRDGVDVSRGVAELALAGGHPKRRANWRAARTVWPASSEAGARAGEEGFPQTSCKRESVQLWCRGDRNHPGWASPEPRFCMHLGTLHFMKCSAADSFL